MRSDGETVAATERNKERLQESKSPNGFTAPKLSSQVIVKTIKNFTCPACKVVLSEAVAINGKVTGWCGNSHIRISVPV